MQEQNKKTGVSSNSMKKSFIKEHKSEFNQITWPSKKTLIKHTITVIVISLVLGLVIFAYDFVIDYLFKMLHNLNT